MATDVLTSPKRDLDFQYFLSSADDELRADYYAGLNKVLKKYGVDGVVLNTANSLSSEDTIIVLAKNTAGESVGGIRIEIKTDDNPLPIEKISTHYKSIINEKIKQIYIRRESIAELCGLWADSEIKSSVFNKKLGPMLCEIANQIVDDMQFENLVTLAASHTSKFVSVLNFQPDQNIPQFTYPDDRYISTLMWKHNATKTEHTFNKELTL